MLSGGQGSCTCVRASWNPPQGVRSALSLGSPPPIGGSFSQSKLESSSLKVASRKKNKNFFLGFFSLRSVHPLLRQAISPPPLASCLAWPEGFSFGARPLFFFSCCYINKA